MSQRNKEILGAIGHGLVPVLPFEIANAKSTMEMLGEEQQANAQLLNDAMNQSSETWHDNSPAEAISQRSTILANRSKTPTEILEKGFKVDYPDQDNYDEITLGHLVTYELRGENITSLLTGASNGDPSEDVYEGLLGVARMVSLKSPIGKAIFGMKPEETKQVLIGRNKQIVRISGIIIPKLVAVA
jgi:transcription elongation GreA/GreB family factor